MFCQCCGIEAPTKKVTFYQNIGLLVMRFTRTVDGELCKSCIHRNFWAMSGKTLFLGWWGMISLIVTPIFLANNIIRYLMALPMPPVPEGAAPPFLTDKIREQITPHLKELFETLNDEDTDFQSVVRRYADRIGITPGQLMLAIQEIVAASGEQSS